MYGKSEGLYFTGGNSMIKFLCWEPYACITVNNRKEALDLIRKNKFEQYKDVCVCIDNIERFSLKSQRAKEYFGIKR